MCLYNAPGTFFLAYAHISLFTLPYTAKAGANVLFFAPPATAFVDELGDEDVVGFDVDDVDFTDETDETDFVELVAGLAVEAVDFEDMI